MSREPIAIVRMASILPGALDAAEFWRNIQAGRSAIRDVPAGRWDVPPEDIFDVTPQPDRAYSKVGGFVEGFKFDPHGLNLDPALALDLDPLFQWVLSVGRTLTSGFDLPRERTGVALANLVLPSQAYVRLGRVGWRQLLRAALGPDANAIPETEKAPGYLNHFQAGLPAGLLARALNLHGGTLALDAACASSLYAIKLAVDQLQCGRADAMIAGGVARTDHLTLALGFSQLRAISKSGHARPFDVRADGLVPGEGCGLFLMRRLSDAQARGEEVLAVIKGVGLSNDGKGRGVLMPSTEGQVRSLRNAYAEAGIEPSSVGLVECHATGTPVGDATEVTTLKNVWGPHAPQGGTAIGSVKSMIGHLLTAAGSAGVIKAVSSIRDAKLPPTLNYEIPSPGMNLDGSPLYINTALRDWKQGSGPRRAAVSAFGFGGCNAHLILEEAPARVATSTPRAPARQRTSDEPLAIVAMNAQFGPCNLDAYRRLVFEGHSALTAPPDGRWLGLEKNADSPLKPLQGTFITRLGVDDPMKLRIPPLEMERMLSQQLLGLLVADGMFTSDDGLLKRIKDRSRVGVVVGMAMEADAGDYAFRWSMIRDAKHEQDPARAAWLQKVMDAATIKCTAESVLGFLANLISNRISARFDFGGPSLSVGAEDASALKALEVASLMLCRGDADAMLVGAVDLPADIRSVLAADAVQGFTRTEPRPFDKRADGTVPGEGAGMVLVKRLRDALSDGDAVLAVIKGVGSAQDGADGSVGAPSARGYSDALKRAYDDAGFPASTVGLLVAHGSGRPAEDTPEMLALHDVFGATAPEPHTALQTVKPVVGHMGAASGMGSLVSAVMALHHRAVPPSKGLEDPAMPELWKGSPFYIVRKARPWLVDEGERMRRAGVSAMSVDGNHVHVVLEEGPTLPVVTPLGRAPEALFMFRGNTRAELVAQVAEFRKTTAGVDVERLAMQRASRHVRGRMPLTLSIVAADNKDLDAKLDKAITVLNSGTEQVMDIHGLFFSSRPLNNEGGIAFVFPGAGNAYAGMAREIVLRYPEMVPNFSRKTTSPRTRSMERWVHPREILKKRVARDELRSANEMIWGAGYYTQMLADSLRHRMDIHPNVALGYSLGESSGLFALDAWSSVDELYTRLTQWPLVTTELAGPMNGVLRAWKKDGVDITPMQGKSFWATWLLVCSPDKVYPHLENEPLVHMAIINAPDECVIAGHMEGCKRVIEKVGCSAHFTPFPVAVHVPEVLEVEAEYRRLHTLPTEAPPGITYYSSGTGQSYALNADSAAESIVAQAIRCVDFPALINKAYLDGVRIFVEVGPRGSCTRWVEKILDGRRFLAVASDRKGRSEFVNLLHVAAQVAAHGVDVDLANLYGAQVVPPSLVAAPARREYPTSRALKLTAPPPRSVVKMPTPPPAPPQKAIVVSTPPVHVPPVVKGGNGHGPVPPPPRPPPSVPRAVSMPPPPPPPAASVATSQAMVVPTAQPMMVAAPVMTAEQADASTALVASFHGAFAQMAASHSAFLENSRIANESMLRMLKAVGMAVEPSDPVAEGKPPVFTREQVVEHGVGTPSKLWGPEYAVFDSGRRMARLPNGPYLLLDRVSDVGQPPRVLKDGAWLVGEYDVPQSAWYFDANAYPTMPFSVVLEAFLQPCGFLASYMGSDLRCSQDRRFRNLGGKAVMHREILPGSGTLRTHARLKKFSEYGDMLVVDFDVEMTQGGVKVMEGSSYFGFFTDEALGAQKGLNGKVPPFLKETLPQPRIMANVDGMPRAPLLMMDRVVALNPTGGRKGLGYARAEKDVNPDEWFYKAHFHQDPVMPGSLGVDGLLQLMQHHMQQVMGVGPSHRFEPVMLGDTWEWTYRGQVVTRNKKVSMEIEVTDAVQGDEPTLRADAYVSVDGLGIYRLDGVGMRAVRRR